MDYYHFAAEDFAADDYFKEWVCLPDGKSDAFWSEFLQANPEKYYDIQEGRELVLGLQNLPQHPDVDVRAGVVWQRIDRSIRRRTWWKRSAYSYASVAALLLIAGLAAAWWLIETSGPGTPIGSGFSAGIRSDEKQEEAINNTSVPMQIELSDGSTVRLEKGSSIRYQNRFADSLRVIYLQGEAFFDVKKDSRRPFIVYANGLVTKVLGTRFSVRARNDDPNVTVSVTSGRVSVYSDGSEHHTDPEITGVVLSPNQKAVYERSRDLISRTLIESPEMLPGLAPASFAFESAPANRVFDLLASVYGIEVVYDADLYKDCQLTVDLTRESLYQKLEVICKVLEVKYKLIDAQVIIYGGGCS